MDRIRDARVPVWSGPYSPKGSPGGFVRPRPAQPIYQQHTSGHYMVGWLDPETEPTLISPIPARRP